MGRGAELHVTDVVVGWPRASDPHRGEEAAFEELGSLLGPDGSLVV